MVINAVTGISGLVGGNLARMLLSQDQRVRGLIHQDTRAVQGLDIEFISGDVLDPASLQRFVQDADVVYHLAAHISLDTNDRKQTEAVNVTGTRNVVEACLECGVRRLVHLSSIHALELNALKTPVDETTLRALSPNHLPYDRSKAVGEMEVHHGIERGLDAVILNPTAIVGPYDFKPSYFGKALIRIAQRKLPALVQGGFDWIDVRDVVAGMLKARQEAPAGSNYILSGHWRSIREVAAQVATITGSQPPHMVFPLWAATLGLPLINILARTQNQEPLYTRVSLKALRNSLPVNDELARRELNHVPRPFKDTITDTIHWFIQNGYVEQPLCKLKESQ